MGIEQTGAGGSAKGLLGVLLVLGLLVLVYLGTRGPAAVDPPRPWHSETPAPSK